MMGGEEDEMDMNFGPPKKKLGGPPSRLAKKTAAPSTGENEEMKVEEKAPVKDTPAPPKRTFGEKPAAAGKSKAAASGPAKPTTAPKVEEEALGEGLSTEESLAIVKGFYSAECMNNFKDIKQEDGSMKPPTWKEKVEGFKLIQSEIGSNNPGDKELEATVKYAKTVMKDFKESNINMLKESVNIVKAMIDAELPSIPKRVLGTFA
jgi:hypothetical protein